MLTPPNNKLKRSLFHDYHEPFIYLVTVTVVERRPILCKVEGSVEQPKVVLTEIGKAVKREIFAIEKRYPQMKVLFNVIMPDHVHIILRVLEELPEHLPLGNIVAAWKQACGKAYSALLAKQTLHGPKAVGRGACGDLKAACSDEQPSATSLTSSEASFSSHERQPQENKLPYRSLFSKGYNDSILTGKHQLRHMLAYVKDNPRRLLIKRQCRELFTIRRGILVARTKFDAVGNIALLQKPLMAVHCRRKWSEAEQKSYAEQCISAAEKGVVLMGAFISKEEKAIEQTAMERHLPIIRLVENGFDELFKPIGQDFDFCAEGQLLLLAPWPYHSRNRKITREQCQLLNEMAETIAMN
jgi:hypothetical protein